MVLCRAALIAKFLYGNVENASIISKRFALILFIRPIRFVRGRASAVQIRSQDGAAHSAPPRARPLSRSFRVQRQPCSGLERQGWPQPPDGVRLPSGAERVAHAKEIFELAQLDRDIAQKLRNNPTRQPTIIHKAFQQFRFTEHFVILQGCEGGGF